MPINHQINVDRNLYNTNFEGYKLNLSTNLKVVHQNLPTILNVDNIKTHSYTPYKVIESRNKLNFIYKNPWHLYGFFYIDEDYSLIYTIINEVSQI